jgi:hypothetical protein
MYMYHRNGLQFKRILVIRSNDLDKILCDYPAGQNGLCCHFVIYHLSKTISMVHGSISLWNKCKLRRLVFFVNSCSIHVHKEVHWSNQMVTFDDRCFERYTRDMMINVSWRFERIQFISYDRHLLDRNILLPWNNDTSLMYPISGWSIIRYFPQLVQNTSLSWYHAAPNDGDYLPSEKRWIHLLFTCRCEGVRMTR